MRPNTASTALTFALVGAAAGITTLLPEVFTVPAAHAAPADEIRLTGKVRDFVAAHPDFDVAPAEGFGQYAGNVRSTLSSGRPTFMANEPMERRLRTDTDLVSYWPFDEGSGNTTADLAYGNNGTIHGAQWVAGVGGGSALHFDGVDDYINVRDAPEIRVTGDVTFAGWFKLDEAFNASSSKTWVISEKYLDNNTDFHLALAGTDYRKNSVTDGSLVMKVEYDHSVRYKWTRTASWRAGEWYHFAFVMDASDSRNNKILVNGLDDTDPDDYGPGNGGSRAVNTDYAADLRIGGKKLDQTMGVRDEVYFKGVIDEFMVFSRQITEEDYTGGVEAGYKVATQWRDDAGNKIAPHTYSEDDSGMAPCYTLNDSAGTAGVFGDAGISSVDSFAQWFNDVPGVNTSSAHPITLTRDGAGVWHYVNNDFYPIDNRLLGNEGDSHNQFFTYHVRATFEYKECWEQYVRFVGGDGVWTYIDGALVMDQGGVGASSNGQHIYLDRLGLNDGDTYRLDLFFAERDPVESVFRLWTSLDLEQPDMPVTVSACFD